MKTNIKTIVAICALGIIGSLNSSASSDSKKELVNDKPEISAIESEMIDLAFSYSAQTFTAIDIEKEIEEYASTENLAEDITLPEEFLNYSAQEFSESDIKSEIEGHSALENSPVENILSDEIVVYSAQVFSDRDFETELKNRQ